MNAIERIVGLGLAAIALGAILWSWLSAGPMPEIYSRDKPRKTKSNSNRTGQ